MELAIIVLAVLAIGIYLSVEGTPVSGASDYMPIAPTGPVQKIAKAIAQAEGFYVQGSIPQRANNPGDLEEGDIGFGVIEGKTIFPSASQGWQRLYAQVQAMLDGSSKIYGPDWTIQDVANEYVSGSQVPTSDSMAWADNVATALGVDSETPIGQVS